LSLEHWETYYRGGALATCPTGPDSSYDQELREVWRAFFGTLTDDARILDVGTGNGAVALIALETAAELGRRWDIHAADLARIDPPRHVPDGARRFAGITFHAGVATEELPFPDAHFDAVSGHYALEYSDTGRALAQIQRVLKPESRAQFIIHHSGSRLIRTGLVSLREAELVFNELKVYRRLRRLLETDHLSPAAAKKAGVELQSAIRVMKLALPQAQQAGGGRLLAVTLDAVKKLLQARTSQRPEAVGLEIKQAEGELRAGVRRLKDLVEHARSEEQMATVGQQATAAGFSVIECVPQHHGGGNLVGWRLLLQRA
jgi:SAM-dependent methyltransferase